MTSDAISTPSKVADDAPRLRGGTVSTTGMIFLVVAATAPLTALSSNISISIGLGAGTETVGYLAIVGALLALFSILLSAGLVLRRQGLVRPAREAPLPGSGG